jgi:hypothetical protein
LSSAYQVQQASAQAAHSTPSSLCAGLAPSAPAWLKISILMQAMPSATTSSGEARRRRGSAPWSLWPTIVTLSGSRPMISDVGATPASLTPYASSR